MMNKLIITIACLLSISLLEIHAVNSNTGQPVPTDQFEHEFEWLSGNVEANPYGISQ
jgi:hypothetical protein